MEAPAPCPSPERTVCAASDAECPRDWRCFMDFAQFGGPFLDAGEDGGEEATPTARYDTFMAERGNGALDAVAESSEMFGDMSMRDFEGRPGAWDRNESWSFVVVDSSERLLGTCGIHRIESLHGVGELGYWVRSSMTSQGIATEATRKLCQWAFADKGLQRIEIIMSVENIASQRVAEKAGAVREGILRQRLSLNGRRHDAVMFAVLND